MSDRPASLSDLPEPARHRVVDQMVRDALVARRPAASDNRVEKVWITSVGRRGHEELLPAATEHVHDVVARFTEEDIAAINHLPGRLPDNVEMAGDRVATKLESLE